MGEGGGVGGREGGGRLLTLVASAILRVIFSCRRWLNCVFTTRRSVQNTLLNDYDDYDNDCLFSVNLYFQ